MRAGEEGNEEAKESNEMKGERIGFCFVLWGRRETRDCLGVLFVCLKLKFREAQARVRECTISLTNEQLLIAFRSKDPYRKLSAS
jgi:hypothetical protein